MLYLICTGYQIRTDGYRNENPGSLPLDEASINLILFSGVCQI